MVTVRLFSFRGILLAVASLLAVVGLTEVAARVYDSATAELTRPEIYDRGLTIKSWVAHHTLKPGMSFAVRNPDSGDKVRVVTTSFGTRGTEPRVPKPAGVFRVLCLGDENTLAPYIEESQTFCGQLQQRLQSRSKLNIEVLNAGVPDYCAALSYIQTRQCLMALEPDVILLNFDLSDIADDYKYRRMIVQRGDDTAICPHPALLPPAASRSPQLDNMFLLPRMVKKTAARYWSQTMLPNEPRGIEEMAGRYMWCEDDPPDWEIYIEQAISPFAAFVQLTKGRQMQFAVASYPLPWQVSETGSDGPGVREKLGVQSGHLYRSRSPFDRLASTCSAERIPFLETTGVFEEYENPGSLFLNNAATMSEAGHAIYAIELETFVTLLAPSVFGPRTDSAGEPQRGSATNRRLDGNRSPDEDDSNGNDGNGADGSDATGNGPGGNDRLPGAGSRRGTRFNSEDDSDDSSDDGIVNDGPRPPANQSAPRRGAIQPVQRAGWSAEPGENRSER